MLIKSNLPCPFCNSSDAYSEYHNGWYCFSCHASKFKDIWDVEKEVIKPTKIVSLPDDFVQKVPEQHCKWWRQYGIEDIVIKCHGVGWSEQYKRIIIPIYNKITGKLLNWQGRAVFPDQTPKYTNITGVAPHFFVANICWATMNINTWEGWSRIILVEDVLSAIKINRIIPVVTLAMLGTGSFKVIDFLKEIKPNQITLWLDGDSAGITGSNKLFKKLNKYFTINQIFTDKDPKELNETEIKKNIGETE